MIKLHKRILMCTTADAMWLAAQIKMAREADRQFRRMTAHLVNSAS